VAKLSLPQLYGRGLPLASINTRRVLHWAGDKFLSVGGARLDFRKNNYLRFGVGEGTFCDMKCIITSGQIGRLVLPACIRKALQVSSVTAFKAEVMGNKVELTLIA
jgi:hypothetical protein